jgi:hypothetical protein
VKAKLQSKTRWARKLDHWRRSCMDESRGGVLPHTQRDATRVKKVTYAEPGIIRRLQRGKFSHIHSRLVLVVQWNFL